MHIIVHYKNTDYLMLIAEIFFFFFCSHMILKCDPTSSAKTQESLCVDLNENPA